jgi:hypothetical protein
MYNNIKSEEELKNKVTMDFSPDFDAAQIII